MIKLFNKIRKQLLIENKMGRYFKYAIGEIILVMIGILLALQVNNWNNNRMLKKEELKVMKSLHKEFSENLVKFDFAYKFHTNRKRLIETIMSVNPTELATDSLINLMQGVNGNYTFDPYQGIYNSIINSGKIELISNDSLKSKIARIQDIVRDYQEEEIGVREFTKQNLYPFQLGEPMGFFIYDLNDKSQSLSIKTNYVKIIESVRFNNLMQHMRGWMRSIFEEGPILRKELLSIINLLKSEIERNN
ncbi:DUF6090 family protein [Winogradskyella alexanderae]|uniref:Uncharacterized protein n=1 Tax=Winogradskyella alexanderae TaxID=2877123 RepID=A0ABS7XPE6_9FLAO|nr:DUF6090 family protein [Winogradskyella alexanderae]MCA0131333.1 hypothetical protein [Winogradskyella alexanderae]